MKTRGLRLGRRTDTAAKGTVLTDWRRQARLEDLLGRLWSSATKRRKPA
ncbi:hypothetical protein EKH55_3993 [Sinorhizobium alkalisoli]|nr:hypothetical protein EKH55_3993 [Sinorhizobium alkalisoli]